MKNNYLINTNRRYKKNNLLKNQQPLKKIIAIEVKLSDYRRGIIQAKRYQYFADQSYLAILKKAAKNLDVESVRLTGVGLILFDELTETIQIIKPKASIYNRHKLYSAFAKETILHRMGNLAKAS